MDFYMARRNGDVSNRVKALEDALSGYAYDDDLQVVRHTDARHLDMDNPRVEVSVIALNASI
jgi:Holliday junction resolvase RusA-like endonuclease